ncbi:MAG: Tim44 domain-containing protein [Rickettsiaceae bacterium]
MSGQLIELIIFAGIAFFVINKLISTLGTTSEDDPTNKPSFFGEKKGLKDITPTHSNKKEAKKANILKPVFAPKDKVELNSLVVQENIAAVREGLADVMNKVPSFNIHNFLRGAKAAFRMIIDAANKHDENEIEALVDKRYIEQFKAMAPGYGEYVVAAEPTMQISEVYMFGNNIFIKILFAGKNITQKIKNLHEEWTFTRSTINAGPEWYLTNIDRPQ